MDKKVYRRALLGAAAPFVMLFATPLTGRGNEPARQDATPAAATTSQAASQPAAEPAAAAPDAAATAEAKPVAVQTGIASWYSGQATVGRAARVRRGMAELTAAHRHLPLGTYVRVTNLANQRSAVVRINDRGPYIRGRIIDVNPAAARKLAMVQRGISRVRMEVLPSAPPDLDAET